jgi:hypothetical protein
MPAEPPEILSLAVFLSAQAERFLIFEDLGKGVMAR